MKIPQSYAKSYSQFTHSDGGESQIKNVHKTPKLPILELIFTARSWRSVVFQIERIIGQLEILKK